LNKNIVVGVDLGINVPAYVATNITPERKAIGDREHFLNTRMTFQRRYKSLQRLKTTAGGKGRTKKLEPLERLRKAEHNWVHTQNHLFSREVVSFAVQTHAATIHMEDLSGFGKDNDGNADERKEFVLRNWSYYELQNMIAYKAGKYGIKVEKIRPAYTSKTCSWCGQQGFRQGVTFICENPTCKKCGEKEHADYNAARNIANSKEIIKKNE
jgi:IS605 OrfB family transposase